MKWTHGLIGTLQHEHAIFHHLAFQLFFVCFNQCLFFFFFFFFWITITVGLIFSHSDFLVNLQVDEMRTLNVKSLARMDVSLLSNLHHAFVTKEMASHYSGVLPDSIVF